MFDLYIYLFIMYKMLKNKKNVNYSNKNTLQYPLIKNINNIANLHKKRNG